MNFSSILTEIEKLDPEVYERTSPRRKVIRNWARNITLTALPFAIGSLFQKAYGKSTASIIDVLNYALTLEYLESEFYTKGAGSTGLIPAGDEANAIDLIKRHENAHVNFLVQAITGAGGTPVTKPTFDFTGGNGSNAGPFLGVFNVYGIFLAVAQVFEDTGVRAYKGAAPDLMTDNNTLEAALRIHSVEARHAAHIREMRAANGTAVTGTLKPWISGNQSNVAAPYAMYVQASYNGEDNTNQGGVQIVNINGQVISTNAATESFDEPLSMTDVLAIVDPFIV